MSRKAEATRVFEKILCPVDFSDCSAAALRYANALARCQEADVTVLHADSFTTPAYFTPAQVEHFLQQWEVWKSGAKDALEQFVRETIGRSHAVVEDIRLVEGGAEQAISDTVRALNPDLVVMGTHGRSGVKRVLLGSVTEQVLRTVSLPLLAVRVGVSRAEIPARRILCAVDDSLAARHALHLASLAGRCFNAALTVLHVRQPQEAHRIGDLHAWIGHQDGLIEVQEVERDGDPGMVTVSVASEGEYDLVVVGARHRKFAGAIVLSVTTVRVVRHCPCPVLVVPEVESRQPRVAET
jgi:nucleotide-binding universal stress UspA family protein